MVHTRSETAPTSCIRAQRCSQSRAVSSLCHDLQAAMHTAASVQDSPLRPADLPLRPRPGALLLRHAGRAGAASAAAAAQPLRRRLREMAAHCACAWIRSMCCAPTDTRYLTAAQTPVRPASSAAAPRGGTSSSSGACPQGRHLAARGIARRSRPGEGHSMLSTEAHTLALQGSTSAQPACRSLTLGELVIRHGSPATSSACIASRSARLGMLPP